MVTYPRNGLLELSMILGHASLNLGLDKLWARSEPNKVFNRIFEQLKRITILALVHHEEAPEKHTLLILLSVGLWISHALPHGLLGLG